MVELEKEKIAKERMAWIAYLRSNIKITVLIRIIIVITIVVVIIIIIIIIIIGSIVLLNAELALSIGCDNLYLCSFRDYDFL